MKKRLVNLILFLAAGPCLAQSSAGYTLDEYAFNAGGGSASSAGYSISMSSIGEALSGQITESPSFAVDAGFVPAYRPPEEIGDLRFTGHDDLVWDADPGAAHYNLYREPISSLYELNYGNCFLQDLPSAVATDTDLGPSGGGYFYLATSVNRLDEESGKGSNSNGFDREGSVCP